MSAMTLAEAKTHLSALVEQAEHGETVRITRRGRPVAQLTSIDTARKPVDLAALQALTAAMPMQAEQAGAFLRTLRDEARY